MPWLPLGSHHFQSRVWIKLILVVNNVDLVPLVKVQMGNPTARQHAQRKACVIFSPGSKAKIGHWWFGFLAWPVKSWLLFKVNEAPPPSHITVSPIEGRPNTDMAADQSTPSSTAPQKQICILADGAGAWKMVQKGPAPLKGVAHEHSIFDS